MLFNTEAIRKPETLTSNTNRKRLDSGKSGAWRQRILILGLASAVIPGAVLYGQVPHDGQMVARGLTTPYTGAWIPGNLGGHWWQPDNALGICRLDAAPAGVNPPFQTSIAANACSVVAKAGGQVVVANPAAGFKAPANAKFLFVPDASSKSNAIVRFVIDPATETIVSNLVMTVKPVNSVGGGGNGARPVALALAPNGTDLYVGYIKSGDIMKITGATSTTSGSPSVARVASTSDGKGVNSFAIFKNDLYLAELGGVGLTKIPDPSGVIRAACSANSPCTAAPPPGMPAGVPSNPAGLTTDANNLYIGDSPLNGTPGIGVVQWNLTTNAVSIYSNSITPAYDGF